jgi:pullulanase
MTFAASGAAWWRNVGGAVAGLVIGAVALFSAAGVGGCAKDDARQPASAAPATQAAVATRPADVATPAPVSGSPATAPAKLAETLKPSDYNAEALLIVHYKRLDDDYANWNLWAWEVGKDGRAHDFKGTDGYGRYAVVPFTTKPAEAGLIVRRGEWEAKDIDRDRMIRFGDKSVTEVWLVSGDESVYNDPLTVNVTTRLVSAFLDTPGRITVAASGKLNAAQKVKLAVTRRTNPSKQVEIRNITQVPANSSRVIYQIDLAGDVADADLTDLQVSIAEANDKPLTVFARDVLTAERFTPLDAKLGYVCTPEKTTFATWSPVAEKVELLVYADATGSAPKQTIAMKKGDRGLWSAELPGDLHRTPYRYRFTSYGVAREVPDIHTNAASADSSYSVVVDLNRLQPEGWSSHQPPRIAKPTDEVIYEIHVRDFSIANPDCPLEVRGTYKGLLEGAKARDGKVSTGLPHLVDLGVTAVHLLPMQDFTAAVGEYNWGYWTALFNVPEGNYSTDPADPTRAITDFREAVLGLHKAGVRVIMDVVYNHTSTSFEHSPFDQTVPYYYFRTTPDGRLSNDAGVGNSVADERPMVRKYIVDSLSFWATQYKIDGFRFDLLGTHRPETVRAICEALPKIRPDITLYGEPWTGGGPTYFGKGAQRGTRMAVFNDHLRHAIRGDLDGTGTGYATGPGGDVPALKRGIAGAIDDFTDNPAETINYVSAHDNLTLWDKISLAQPRVSNQAKRNMQKLAHGIVLTSQGIAFIHGGCDFARTKGGNKNSYNAGDAVNQFDWMRKAEYGDVNDYVRGLIRLRKAHPAFRMTTAQDVRTSLKFLSPAKGVAFTLDGKASGDAWNTIFVAYNGEPTPTLMELPEGTWNIVADANKAGVDTLRQSRGMVEMPGFSMVVAYRSGR